MSETYTIGGDTLYKFDNPNLAGQSFMPMEDHILEYIDLELRGPLIIPLPVILVYMADLNGHPIGDYISLDEAIVEKLCWLWGIGRVRFRMKPVLLYKGSRYVIVAGNYPPLLGSSAYWLYDKDDATYPRGHRISTPDHGATWVDHLDDDHIFAEFGTPPLPKPEPSPPIKLWAPIDYVFTPWDTGIFITLPTNVPCHLTCYWTDKKPLKHHTERIVRGIRVPWGTYFCFVAWYAVEQTEPGDTLYHTFNLSPWEVCQTRWLAFRGTIDLKPPYWEAWGDTLTKNHPWVLIPEHTPPDYNLTDGLLTLTSIDYESKGIRFYPDEPFLRFHNAFGAPLCFNAYHTHTDGNPDTHRTAIMLYTTKDVDSYHIILVISRGNLWVTYGENKAAFATRGIMDYGQGPYGLNLVKLWVELREMAGLPADPTGWELAYVRVELLQEPVGGTTILTNDYIDLFYPPLVDGDPPPEEPISSPHTDPIVSLSLSVGPIFEQHLDAITSQDVILRPNAPGDQCSMYITGNGLDCPDHWQTVAVPPPDMDIKYLIGNTINKWWGYDLYNLPSYPMAPIEKVTIVSRFKATGGYAYVRVNAHHIKTHGTPYITTLRDVFADWRYYSKEYINNPYTGEPWTQEEIDDLQIGVGLRHTWGVGWARTGSCSEVYVIVRRALKYHF